jgi:hypothetical protein
MMLMLLLLPPPPLLLLLLLLLCLLLYLLQITHREVQWHSMGGSAVPHAQRLQVSAAAL